VKQLAVRSTGTPKYDKEYVISLGTGEVEGYIGVKFKGMG
jgi:hypothetical protein